MSLFKKEELEVIRKEDIDIRDPSNPKSVINLVPSSMGNAIKAIPLDFFAMDEEELKKMARADIVENRLRHSFWLEYGHACLAKREINMSNIVNGVCSKDYFLKHILTNSFKLAYMLTPPPDYRVQMAEILTLGLAKLREILAMPIESAHPKTGEKVVDSKLAGVQARIVEDLMTRSHGHPLRTIEVTSKNMNLNVDVTNEVEIKDVSQIDAEIKKLEGELGGKALSGNIKEAKKV